MPKDNGYVRVLQHHGGSLRTTIPLPLAEELGLNGGDDLYFERHKGHLEVYPVEVRPKTGIKRFGGEE